MTARRSSRVLAGTCLSLLLQGSTARGAPPEHAKPSLSEEQAVRLALAHSHSQKAWAARHAVAKARVDEATAWSDPELRLTGLPVHRAPDSSSPDTRPLDRLDLSLRWSPPQPGVGSNLGAAASASADSMGLQAQHGQRSLDASVRKLYLRLVGAQSLATLSRQALALRQRLLEAAQRQAETGTRTGLAHSLAKLDRWEAQAQLDRDNAQVTRLWQRLASLTRLAPHKPPSLQSKRLQGRCALPKSDLKAQLSFALAHRSDLRAARRTQDAAGHRLEASRWQRLPWLRFGEIGYRFEESSALDFVHLGLAFDLPLSGAYGSRVEQWVARRGLADAERAELERQVTRQIKEAWNDLSSRVQSLKTFEQSAAAVDEALNHVSRALDSGSLDLMALASIETRQAQARRAWSQARIGCHLATVELALASGRPLLWAVEEETASAP